MVITATIRRVWMSPSPQYASTVIVRDEENRTDWVLWSRNQWLCALLHEKYGAKAQRPLVTIELDPASKHLEGIVEAVA